MGGTSFDPAHPPLTVKPRKPHTKQLPLIIVTDTGTLIEETGEVDTPVVPRLRELTPALVVCEHPDRFLAEAHRLYRDDPEWNWRVIPTERQIGYGELAQVREEMLISYCGFRHGKVTHYFRPIGPAQYGRHALADLGAEDEPKHVILHRWALQLREWCASYNLRVTSTSGGVAAQLLRDARFYPRPRRKVPTATNENARPHLPGNHYELAAEPGRLYGSAYVLDQEAAHHHAALTVDLPDADTLYARGHWRNPDSLGAWASVNEIRGLYGLVKVQAHIPDAIAHDRWTPHNLTHPGTQPLYLYTNELDFVRSLGVDIYHVIAAWLSEKVDAGIKRYAEWAMAERQRAPRWLKGTLLSTYGILGAKPRRLASCYWNTPKGEPTQVWLESELTDAKRVESRRERQTPIAHLIQRGMIEAETRRESLILARRFHREKVTVHAIQADAVIIDGTIPQLSLLPHPWRVKERLGWVRFDNLQVYSGEPIITVQSHYPTPKQGGRNGNGRTAGFLRESVVTTDVPRRPGAGHAACEVRNPVGQGSVQVD